jgi:hypothetical protein
MLFFWGYLSALQHDGERDSRYPNDFANNSNGKLDDVNDGDEDDIEDDEPELMPTKGGTRREGGSDVKPKTEAVASKTSQPAHKNSAPMPDVSVILFSKFHENNMTLWGRWILRPIDL